MSLSTRFMLVALIGFLAADVVGPASSSGQARVDLAQVNAEYRLYLEHEHSWLCGTGLDATARSAPLAKGTPVYFQLDPPIVAVDYEGTVTLRDFTVVGDVSKLTFDPSIFDTNANHANETWKRKRTASIGGVKVSIFEPSWSAAEFRLFYQGKNTGFDRPDLFLGSIKSNVGNRGATQSFSVWARVAPTGLADVTVKTIGDDTAYSSDVINVVIPGYGTTQITGGNFDVDARTITKKIYENFKDTSHLIAIVPRNTHIDNVLFAFHRITRNTVTGVGLNKFDNDAEYGSGGTLLGVEYYPNVALARTETVVHEIAHGWGHYLDWAAIAGITGAGHEPAAHTPLITDGTTLVGAVLEGDREVSDTARAFRRAFAIGFPDPPFTYHPLTLYAMGVLPVNRVPAMEVFVAQGQFDPDTSISPDVGTPVTGSTVDIDINDITAVHGSRGGPKMPKKLKRTVVIVSGDEIMSQEEFNYWTWVVQRQNFKKKGNGVMTLRGYGSFNQSADRKAKLESNIDPKAGGKLKGKLKVSYPQFGTTDWKAVRFDKKIPTRIKTGKGIDLSGRVIATDRSDFDDVLVRFSKHDPVADAGRVGVGVDRASAVTRLEADVIRVFMDVAGNGNFDGKIKFGKEQKGRWWMEVFLFWPDSGSQFSRVARTPFHVE